MFKILKKFLLGLLLLLLVLCNVCADTEHRIDSLLNELNYANDSAKAEVYILLANDHISSDPEIALMYAAEAEKLAIDISDPLLIGKAKSRKGVAYYYMHQMELSTENFFEALTIFDSLDLRYEKYRFKMKSSLNMPLSTRMKSKVH